MFKFAQSEIDSQGYRPNVGIILCNKYRQVLWARRCSHNGWQFPQGGVEPNETIEQAVFRELNEEVGLLPEQVKMVGRTQDWLHYDVPNRIRNRYNGQTKSYKNYAGNSDVNHLGRRRRKNAFRGQKQMWFLFHLLASDQDVQLNNGHKPEFDSWVWVDYWAPLRDIVAFKKTVYKRALTELEPLLDQMKVIKYQDRY